MTSGTNTHFNVWHMRRSEALLLSAYEARMCKPSGGIAGSRASGDRAAFTTLGVNDMSDDFKEMREESQRRRKANRDDTIDVLNQNNIHYESRNYGRHLIISLGQRGAIDYWPETGLWTFHGKDSKERGIANLIKYIKGE